MNIRFNQIAFTGVRILFVVFFLLNLKSYGQIPVDTIGQEMDTLTGFPKETKANYKPDTIYLNNGDRITGKILSFEQGRLSLDGQGPGDVSLKWYKIVTIGGGNRVFKVEDIYGVTYIGRIVFSKDSGEVIVTGKNINEVKILNIIRIYPLEAKWHKRIKGDLGAGVNYTKSPEVLRINADYNLYYVISRWRFINNFSFMSTATEGDPSSLRMQISLEALYALPKKWVIAEFNSFNRNDELGIKSRISFGAGIGNNIVQTEVQRLLLLTGIVQNSEKDIESKQVASNFEWPITVQHTIYSFIRPDLSSTTSITSFVGITEAGRRRVDASTDISWEFVKDLKLILSFYYNFDNKTLEGKNTKTDYGTVISLAISLK
jgi:hypothetical protein